MSRLSIRGVGRTFPGVNGGAATLAAQAKAGRTVAASGRVGMPSGLALSAFAGLPFTFTSFACHWLASRISDWSRCCATAPSC